MRIRIRVGVLVSALCLALASAAQTAPPVAVASALPSVQGTTLEGRPFELAALRGKVVLLMFWSTDCAVCRDKMAELRQNYLGWQGKPFELVLVSTDRRVSDLQAYGQILSHTVPVSQRFTQLWAGAPGYRDNLGRPGQLPATWLIDRDGRVVESFAGRIPAQAWDRIADLL